MPEFQQSGVDAIVGSVGNGSTLRLISDIPGVKYTEGRFLPYFFPDTFHEGGDPVREAKENWVTARRAILRKPIDRIGYGGYLKLACEFPEFLDYVESVCNEFRELYENIKGTTPYCVKTVAVLNSWGQQRAWGCHLVHHALYQKQNYSYAGVIEALSGAPFDVRFISFDDLRADAHVLDGVDVLINVGDGDTAHTGGGEWEDPAVAAAVRGFVYNGGGIVGVGEPSGHQYEGHYLQLAGVLGVEKETGFTLGYDKYNWDEHPGHFILEDCTSRWISAREKRASTRCRTRRSWCSGKKRCRWPCTRLAKAGRCTSAACRTALKTAAFCTAASCGAPTTKKACTNGSAATSTWRYTPM